MMYHSEGYVDRHSYFTKDNMWSFGIEQEGRTCYFWCVTGPGTKDTKKHNGLRTVLSEWFYQELPAVLEKGSVYIQKELNRLGERLDEMLLYLYYRNKMYFHGKTAEEVDWSVIGNVGVCISFELTVLKEVMKCLSESNTLRAAWTDTGHDQVNSKSTRDAGREHMARFGNVLKRHMLKASREERMEQGFFMLWEDSYAL